MNNSHSFLLLLFDTPTNVAELMSSAHSKVFVFVNILSIFMAYFMESIHVELADEGREVSVNLVMLLMLKESPEGVQPKTG